jgi:hypothetical protein
MSEWHPFPKQTEALQRIEFEILYGGARGGGKTDAGLVWLTDYIDNPHYRALVIRRNADDLSDWVDRAVKFYKGLGAKIAYRPAVITFKSGAVIRTGHLKDDQAYTKYQGQEYQRILIEELTQIPEEKRYLQLLSSCRSTDKELVPQVFCTTNPGGVGHVWVKKRFIDVAPPMEPYTDPNTGQTRIYIPATVDDNPILNAIDPDYVKFLDGLKETDEQLWKAWRHGDWNTFAGQYFKEWQPNIHTCRPFIPRKENHVFVGGLDWGREKPFALYFDTIKKDKFEETTFYRCRTFCEVYGTNKRPQEWAKEIEEKLEAFKLTLDDIAWIRCDNQIFTVGNDMSKSIADQFVDYDERYRSLLQPASKDRIGCWENLHNWLSIAPDGTPYWQVATNCINFIRTFPSLVHDELHVEDIDTEGEDHSDDAQRYEKKHLKWIDARLGGVKSNKKGRRVPLVIQKNDQGQEIPIELEKFEGKTTSEHVISR